MAALHILAPPDRPVKGLALPGTSGGNAGKRISKIKSPFRRGGAVQCED
jgi:hypothetical protein